MAEHRVEFVEELDLVFQLLCRHSHRFRQRLDILLLMGEELVQRRVKEADGYRQPLHFAEDADEITFLHRQNLGEGLLSAFQILGENHLPDGGDPVRFEKHMLGAAETDPLGAELAGYFRVVGRIGIGSHPEPADAVHPIHQRAEIAGHLGGDGRHFAEHHLAGRAVEGDDVTPLDQFAVSGGEGFGLVVDLDLAAAGDAAFAHASGDNSGVGGHAAAGGEDPLGGVHAVDILRTGFDSYQNDPVAGLRGRLRFIGGKDNRAGSGAG